MATDDRSLKVDDPKDLEALGSLKLTIPEQARVDGLVAREKSGEITAAERSELDALLDRIDRLNLVKAKAVCALQEARKGA